MLGITLDYATGLSRPIPEPTIPTPPVVPAPAKPLPIKVTSISEPAKVEFKGFLYVQCEECGKFKGFMPKTPISSYYCDCGHITKLTNMRPLHLDCKCGQKFKYLTNTTDSIVSIDCINCGSPVDLEFHEKKQEYVTIGQD